MAPRLPVVRVEPLGVDIEVPLGDSLMLAAQRAGLIWPTRCGGMAICTACAVEVLRGAANFSSISETEADALKAVRVHATEAMSEVRLACQAKPLGDALVVKRGVRAASDDGMR